MLMIHMLMIHMLMIHMLMIHMFIIYKIADIQNVPFYRPYASNIQCSSKIAI